MSGLIQGKSVEGKVPENPEELQAHLLDAYPTLSKRLKQVARFALDHPNDMALETIAVIANRASVQPSTMIRFAKAFGFPGFKDMQRVYQQKLTQHSSSYGERLRLFREQNRHGSGTGTNTMEILREFCSTNMISLEYLPDGVSLDALEAGVELLFQAHEIHVLGLRRSFPVASYLSYMLGHLDCRVRLIDGVGGMLRQQVRRMDSEDVLVAITFSPYAAETLELVEEAVKQSVAVLAITDSPVSPLAEMAEICLEVRDPELHGFRSLTASMCLAQSLAVGLGVKQDPDHSK